MPLSVEETYGYIHHRLRVAGSQDGAAFSREAMDAVYFYSGGVPRVMNLICEHSLINAYSDGVRPVQPDIVENVAREFRFDDFRPLPARFDDRPVAEVIPMDSSGSRMRMSALRTRESVPIEQPAIDDALLAEWVRQSSLTDPRIATASVEPAAHRMAAEVPEVAVPKATVEPSVPAPRAAMPSPAVVSPAAAQTPQVPEPAVASALPSEAPRVRSPFVVSSAPSSAPPVRPPAAAPSPSPSWNVPRPVANMSWSRRASVKPIALRLRTTTGALLEASVTRIKHKLDELRAVEKLQRFAQTSIRWLRQPIGSVHRTPFGTREKP
jgi:hypothetical protein